MVEKYSFINSVVEVMKKASEIEVILLMSLVSCRFEN